MQLNEPAQSLSKAPLILYSSRRRWAAALISAFAVVAMAGALWTRSPRAKGVSGSIANKTEGNPANQAARLLDAARADSLLLVDPKETVEFQLTVAAAYSEIGDRVRAGELVADASKSAAAIPDKPSRARALILIAQRQMAADDKAQLPATIEKAAEIAASPGDFADLTSLAIASGNLDQARRFLRQTSSDAYWKRVAYLNAAKGMAKFAKPEDARAIATQAGTNRDAVLGAVAVTLGEVGNNSAAADTLEMIKDPEILPLAWAQVSLAQARHGDVQVAQQSLERAKAALPADHSMDRMIQFQVAWVALLAADKDVLQHDHTGAISQITVAMSAANMCSERTGILCESARRLSRLDDQAMAMRILQELVSDADLKFEGTSLIDAYQSIGKLSEAMALMRRCPDLSDRTWATALLAMAQRRAGDLPDALTTLQEAQSLASELSKSPASNGRAAKDYGYSMVVAATTLLQDPVEGVAFLIKIEPDPRVRIESYCQAVEQLLEPPD